MYKSIFSIPALNYYYFQLYYRLYCATSLVKIGEYPQALGEIRQMAMVKCSYEEIIKRCDIEASKNFNEANNFDYALPAFACLMPDVKDVKDEIVLKDAAVMAGLSYVEICKEIDLVADRFAIESQKFSNNAGNIRRHAIMRGKYITATFDDIAQLKFDLSDIFIRDRAMPVVNPDDPAYEVNAFKEGFTKMYISLGYTETDLRQVSAYELMVKMQIETEKNKPNSGAA